MSARRQKRERADIRATGDITEKKDKYDPKIKARSRRFQQICGTIIGAAAVLGIVAYIIFNSQIFYSMVPAVSVGGHDYSAVEYNFFLVGNQTYQLYLNYGLINPSSPLSSQQYDDTQTLEEVLRAQALDNMTMSTMLYDAGKAEGFAMPDDGSVISAEDQIASLRSYAVSAGSANIDDYLEDNYGKGMTEELMTKLIDLTTYSGAYSTELTNRTIEAMTDEDRDAKYAEFAVDYDLNSFYVYKITAAADPESGSATEATLADAKSIADVLAAAPDGETFGEAVYDIVPEDQKQTYSNYEYTLKTNVSPASLSGQIYADWVKADNRVEGDTEIFAEDDGYTVVLFVERNKNQYNRATFRDIVIGAETDTEASEEAVAAAQLTAEQTLAEWEAGEATETSFGALASERSSDTASSSSGGLVSNAAMGGYAYEIEDWIYAPERQPGDTTIVYVDSNNQFAYHILYYVSAEEQRYDRTLAEDRILTDFFEQWQTEREPNYAVTEKFGFGFRIK